MVSHGGVAPFDGDLDDYQRYLLDEAKRQRELAKVPKTANKAAPVAASLPAEQVTLWKKELQKTESRMQILSAEGAALEGKLASKLAPAEIAEPGKRLKTVNDELKTLEDRWLLLTTQIEEATSATV